MRDIYIAAIVLSLLPAAFLRPYIGVYLWAWLSLMAPHRLSWGFSYDFPYVYVVALVTLAGLLLSPERKSFPFTASTVTFVLFTLWLCVTTLFALWPDAAQARLIFVLKVFALSYVALLTINTRERLHMLVWVIVISVGFYGVKGGIFTLLTGGGSRIYGPPGSFIEDNNHMALALVMMVPLFRYLQLNSEIRLVRFGLGFSMAMTIVSALASYSRGAMLALSVTLIVLVLQTRRRFLAGVIAFAAFGGALALLPTEWFDRMSTIEEYQEDGSTQGRFEIWTFSTEVALSRPVVGGGFDMLFDGRTYQLYGSTIRPRSAHSIIFQVLGEHGFVGLFLFLMIGTTLLFTAQSIKKRAKDHPTLQWARDLASMMQVSLIGYFVAGLFLNLAFFDLIYLYIPIVVGTATVVTRAVAFVPATGSPMQMTALPGLERPRASLGVRPT